MKGHALRIWLPVALLWALVWTAGGPTSAVAGGGLAAIDAYQVARHHLANGDREQALGSFNEALRLNPQFVQAYVGRGKLLAEMGQYSSALSDLNFALHLQPTHAEGFAYRGFALLALGRPQEALPDLDTALRLDASYARVHYLRGQTLRVMGRGNEAEVSLAAALELDPTIEVVQVVTAVIDPETNIGSVQLAGPSALDRTSIMPSTVITPPPVDRKREGNMAHFSRHPSLANLQPPAVSRPPVPGAESRRFNGPIASAAAAIRPLKRDPVVPSGGASEPAGRILRAAGPGVGKLGAIPQAAEAAVEETAEAAAPSAAAATAITALPQPTNQEVEQVANQAIEQAANQAVEQAAGHVGEQAGDVPLVAEAAVEPVVESPRAAEERVISTEEFAAPSAEPLAAPASPTWELALPLPMDAAANVAVVSPVTPLVELPPVLVADETPTRQEAQPFVREVYAPPPTVQPVIIADDQIPAPSTFLESPGLLPSKSAEDAEDRLTAALESAQAAAAERVGPPLATDAPVEELPTMIVTDQPIVEFIKEPVVTESAPLSGDETDGRVTPAANLRELDAAVGARPDDAELRLRRAALRLEHDQPLAAVADFNEALKLEPARIEAYHGRADANQRLGRFVEAVEDYSIVLQLDDHHASALIERGRCLALLGQAVDAERDRAAALALDPSLAKTGPKYGAAFASDDGRAPSHPVAPTAFGNLFGETTAGGVVTTAEPAASQAVFVSDDAAPQNAAVFAFASDDAPAEAEFRSLSDLIAQAPGEAPLYVRRARVALALGLVQEAVTDLTAALQRDAECGVALALRSRAYAALGRLDEADADQRRAAELMTTPQ